MFLTVAEGSGVDDGEADEEYVRLRVRERSEAVEGILAGSVQDLEGLPCTTTLPLQWSNTVGMYSPEKLFVVYV